jgi:hypothetical protein
MTDQPTGSHHTAADLAAIMRLTPGSAYGDLVADETSRRRTLYELLANSADPMWKEIGTQLRDGQLDARDLLRVDAYASHLMDAIEKHADNLPAALTKTCERLEAEADEATRS